MIIFPGSNKCVSSTSGSYYWNIKFAMIARLLNDKNILFYMRLKIITRGPYIFKSLIEIQFTCLSQYRYATENFRDFLRKFHYDVYVFSVWPRVSSQPVTMYSNRGKWHKVPYVWKPLLWRRSYSASVASTLFIMVFCYAPYSED